MTPDTWPVNDRAAFGAALDAWLRETWDPSLTVRQWWALLADAGLTVPTWARQLGGLSATADVQQLVEASLVSAGALAPPLHGAGVAVVGSTLRQHASPAQSTRLLRPLVRGEQAWCLLAHEPGGELPGVATRAVRTGADWTIEGVKSCASDVEMADRALVLVTTDPDAPPRRGLTCFVIDLDQPGVTVETRTVAGEPGRGEPGPARVVVFDQAVARADDAIGAIGGGWPVAQTALGHEQTSLSGRIRRGLVEAVPGTRAGDLDRVAADVIATHRRADPPPHDRRS